MPEVGERWGYREKARTLGEAVRPVEVLQLGPRRSRKVRVRWLDGDYDGLDEWVPEARLVVRWDQAEQFVADETALLALREVQPEPPPRRVTHAVRTVWFATKAPGLSFDVQDACPVEVAIDDFQGLPVTAEELLETPGAFIDSHGELRAGQDAAVDVAQRLCRAQAEEVLGYAGREVDRCRRAALTGWHDSEFNREGGFHIDREWAREFLADAEATSDLLRAWCGLLGTQRFDEIAALRSEVDRLGTLIEQTANWLKSAGHPQKAAMLLKDWRSRA